MDKEIELREGKTISELFESIGEEGFREKEYHYLQEVLARETRIISLGGGTPLTEKCRNLIKENTKCIWLKASADTLAEHLKYSWLNRPILADISQEDKKKWKSEIVARIISMLEERDKFYEEIADFTIEVDGYNIDEVINMIVTTLNDNL